MSVGRHSAGDDRVFVRSLVMTIAKWIALATLPVIAAVGVYQLVKSSNTEEPKNEPAAVASKEPSPSPAPSPSPEPSPSPVPSPSPSPTRQVEGEGRLQVLNGSGVSGQGTKAAAKLKEAGYEIVATGNAVRRYDKTTVFYQPGHEALAREVARFIGTPLIEQAPSSLDKTIPVTVVVGADYRD